MNALGVLVRSRYRLNPCLVAVCAPVEFSFVGVYFLHDPLAVVLNEHNRGAMLWHGEDGADLHGPVRVVNQSPVASRHEGGFYTFELARAT